MIGPLRRIGSLRTIAPEPDIEGRRHTEPMPAISTLISQSKLLDQRLSSQHLASTMEGSGDVTAAVRQLFAVQSQDFAQSLWSVGLRTPWAHRSDLLATMAAGSIVRSSSLRGTLMMVAAEDLRDILALTAGRTIASMSSRQRQLELDEATMTRSHETIEAAVSGRKAMGRQAILRTLEGAGIRTDSQRGCHILWLLAERGIVCWAPRSALSRDWCSWRNGLSQPRISNATSCSPAS